MTRAEIRQRILTGLNESATSPVFWSTGQMSQVIADASEVLAEEAQAVKRTAFTVLRPGTTYYATRGLAPDLMAPYRIWLPSLSRRLTAATVGQLDRQHEQWQTVTGDPEYWFPMGWDWFGVYPRPAAGGGTMRVDYLAWPRILLDDSDEPEFLHADHDALVLYGVYEGLLKRWNLEEALIVFSLFLERIGKAHARGGDRQMQARTWQAARQPGTPFRSGLGDRFSA